MKTTIKALFTFLFIFSSTFLKAQQEVEMADTMRSEGKIYVVVSILVLVLAGLFTYLSLIDRKVSRLESRLREKKL